MYYRANYYADEMLLHASFKEEKRKWIEAEMGYEWEYRKLGSYICLIQRHRLGLYNEMKKMKSSIKEIDEE
jgi:hypothetical protein